MRFGLSLPHYGFSLPSGEISFVDAAGWAARAEEVGFDSVWVSDHFFYSFARYGADPGPIASLEPITTLAGIAAVTDRIRLGTLVLCASFRPAPILAKAAATIDRLSGGRFDLGLGAGWLEEEFEAFGYRFGSVGDRYAILEETVQAVAALFDGRPVTFDGATVRLRDAVLQPRTDPRPPIWLGGKGGPRLLRLAARHADGWNVVWRMSPATYASKLDDVERACEGTDRDPATLRRSVGLYGVIGEDRPAARAAFERARAGAPGDALVADDFDSWRADTLSGSPDDVLERVAAFEELGVEELIVAPWSLPFAIHEPEQVDLFAERVIRPLRIG